MESDDSAPARSANGHREAAKSRASPYGPLVDTALVPLQVEKIPQCTTGCLLGGDVRGWIGVIAQRHKLNLNQDEAYSRAWNMIAAVNPFAATLGRICPHPCESRCTRSSREGAVAINAIERFLGDWALQQRLALPILDSRPQLESIGVLGAGPAGLSFAYQMARRGYRVTVYDEQEHPGGMLRRGVPAFRLSADVLDAEIQRILDIGIELRPLTSIGHAVSARQLRERHRVLFIGIGASRGARLDVPGERGDNVWLGVDYLSAVKRGDSVAIGSQVVVIGGGDTAVDAARVARRAGANVTILYRRTRGEMSANTDEVEAALSEGVDMRYRSSLLMIERSGDTVTGVVAQRMRPTGRDASGRRRYLPLAHTEFRLPASAVIAAVSQGTDWSGIEEFEPFRRADADALQGVDSQGILVVAGGDVLKPGLAGSAIAHGRRAAESVHARLRGGRHPSGVAATATTAGPTVKVEYYPSKERARMLSRPVEQRLRHPDAEIDQTLSNQAFLDEVTRCFSCGLCYGCEQCFMFCNAAAFRRLETKSPGAYFALDLERCDQCGKCVELCPCGFLSFGLRTPGGDRPAINGDGFSR